MCSSDLEVTVPWVDAATVNFYQRVATVRHVAERARMSLRLPSPAPTGGDRA